MVFFFCSKWQPNLKEAILKLEEAIETEIDKVFKDSGFRKEVVEVSVHHLIATAIC